MKSGPGPSTIELGAKPSVIEPPLPSEATSKEPFASPRPLGEPSTISGRSACPKSDPGPGLKDSTEVAKPEGNAVEGAGASVAAEPHAEQSKPTNSRATARATANRNLNM